MRQLDGKFSVDGDRIIKTSNGKEVPKDEPLFFLRARDRLAVEALHHYRVLSIHDGCNDYHIDGVNQAILRFERFAEQHRTKQPGITRGL